MLCLYLIFWSHLLMACLLRNLLFLYPLPLCFKLFPPCLLRWKIPVLFQKHLKNIKRIFLIIYGTSKEYLVLILTFSHVFDNIFWHIFQKYAIIIFLSSWGWGAGTVGINIFSDWCSIKKLTVYSQGFHNKIKRIRNHSKWHVNMTMNTKCRQ